MPGPNSAIRENKEKILQTLDSIHGLGLDDLKNDFISITTMMDAFYQRDPNTGKYPPFGENNRNTFMMLYSQMAERLQTLMLTNNSPELKEFARDLSKDISAISQAEIGKFTNLPRLMEAAHPEVVDITGATLGKAGANLSSRVPMTIVNENGEEIKGYFTPENKFDAFKLLEQKVNEEVGRVSKYYPDAVKMQEFMQKFREYAINEAREAASEYAYQTHGDVEPIDPESIDYFGRFNEMLTDSKYPGDMRYFERMTDMMRIVGVTDIPDVSHLAGRDFDNITGFEQAINNVAVGYSKILTNYGIYHQELNLDVGMNIDDRNAAMSTVAGLLGVPNVIVKSKPMTVINNGVETKGTFLPNAEGLDIGNINVDELKKSGVSFYNQPKISNGFKDLADMQVLDFICGNIDRHNGNMLYQFDETGKFVGAKGIDNDASFGSRAIDPRYGENRLPPPGVFGFVSRSVANKVMNMTPEMLKTSLASHNLGPDELNAACDRLRDMQNAIREGNAHYARKPRVNANVKGAYENNLDKGFIQVIPDDDFAKIDMGSPVLKDKLQDEVPIANGQTTTVRSMLTYATMAAAFFDLSWTDPKNEAEAREKYHEVSQPIVNEARLSDARGMESQKTVYDQKLTELKSHDKWYIRSSPEFRDMRTALEILSKITKEYQGRELDQDGYNRMKEQMDIMEQRNNDYIEMKEKQTDRSAYANERLEFAKQFKNFVAEKKSELEQRVKTEVNVREDRKQDAKLIMDDIKTKLTNNEMTPALAGEAIKAANEASKLSPIKSKESVEAMNLVNNAIKYLKAEPDRINQSGLSKKDLMTAVDTVKKGMEAKNMTKEKAMETPEVQAAMGLN